MKYLETRLDFDRVRPVDTNHVGEHQPMKIELRSWLALVRVVVRIQEEKGREGPKGGCRARGGSFFCGNCP